MQLEVRRLVRTQFMLAGLFVLAALIAARLSIWGLAFAAGALLASVNLYSLAKFVQHIVRMQKGAVAALLIRFYGRLILTGAALYGLIVWLEVPVWALLAGLSTVLVTALYWGATRLHGHNVKEA
jgi:hypothetical protein